jgi:hypothetical protein
MPMELVHIIHSSLRAAGIVIQPYQLSTPPAQLGRAWAAPLGLARCAAVRSPAACVQCKSCNAAVHKYELKQPVVLAVACLCVCVRVSKCVCAYVRAGVLCVYVHGHVCAHVRMIYI